MAKFVVVKTTRSEVRYMIKKNCNVFSLNKKYGCALSEEEARSIADSLNANRHVGDHFIKTHYSITEKY